MTEAELIAACRPCRFCGRKCFAEFMDLAGDEVDGIEVGELLPDGRELHYYEDRMDEPLRNPGSVRLVRINQWCEEGDAVLGFPGCDKDDCRTAMNYPAEAVAEWNERFGRS